MTKLLAKVNDNFIKLIEEWHENTNWGNLLNYKDWLLQQEFIYDYSDKTFLHLSEHSLVLTTNEQKSIFEKCELCSDKFYLRDGYFDIVNIDEFIDALSF